MEDGKLARGPMIAITVREAWLSRFSTASGSVTLRNRPVAAFMRGDHTRKAVAAASSSMLRASPQLA